MITRRIFSSTSLAAATAALSGCSSLDMARDDTPVSRIPPARTLERPDYAAVYGEYPGERFAIRSFDHGLIDPVFLRQTVVYRGREPQGTVIVDTPARHLYFVEGPGRATRYGVGVGREGFAWAGGAKINLKRDWPDWVPPADMIARLPEIRNELQQTSRGPGVPGGPRSPLGARAMYLFGEGRDLGFRIHGTTEPETVGANVSSGCIRMINQDIALLYTRAAIGTPVVVLG